MTKRPSGSGNAEHGTATSAVAADEPLLGFLDVWQQRMQHEFRSAMS
jgi:hypothetical protein